MHVNDWIKQNPIPNRALPEGHRPCPACLGRGVVVSRFGNGYFPDEDTCNRCKGSGHVQAETGAS